MCGCACMHEFTVYHVEEIEGNVNTSETMKCWYEKREHTTLRLFRAQTNEDDSEIFMVSPLRPLSLLSLCCSSLSPFIIQPTDDWINCWLTESKCCYLLYNLMFSNGNLYIFDVALKDETILVATIWFQILSSHCSITDLGKCLILQSASKSILICIYLYESSAKSKLDFLQRIPATAAAANCPFSVCKCL